MCFGRLVNEIEVNGCWKLLWDIMIWLKFVGIWKMLRVDDVIN